MRLAHRIAVRLVNLSVDRRADRGRVNRLYGDFTDGLHRHFTNRLDGNFADRLNRNFAHRLHRHGADRLGVANRLRVADGAADRSTELGSTVAGGTETNRTTDRTAVSAGTSESTGPDHTGRSGRSGEQESETSGSQSQESQLLHDRVPFRGVLSGREFMRRLGQTSERLLVVRLHDSVIKRAACRVACSICE